METCVWTVNDTFSVFVAFMCSQQDFGGLTILGELLFASLHYFFPKLLNPFFTKVWPMAKFQVVNMKLLEGNAKSSGKPYKMLIASGMFTGDDGTMEVGEINFMERPGFPLPMHLKPGGTYNPTVGASVRDGKLTFVITELKEITASGKPLQAAA